MESWNNQDMYVRMLIRPLVLCLPTASSARSSLPARRKQTDCAVRAIAVQEAGIAQSSNTRTFRERDGPAKLAK